MRVEHDFCVTPRVPLCSLGGRIACLTNAGPAVGTQKFSGTEYSTVLIVRSTYSKVT